MAIGDSTTVDDEKQGPGPDGQPGPQEPPQEPRDGHGPTDGPAEPPGAEPEGNSQARPKASAPHPNIGIAADKFLAWQQAHIAAPEHNHTISTVYALMSHYKAVVPVMPKLVYYATMNTSGKTTAAKAVMYAGNFAPMARRISKLSAAAIIRLANSSGMGVPVEDAHRFPPGDNIFHFIVNSFPVDGVHVMADLQDQKNFIVYEIGGIPIVITTNAVDKLDQDVLRRCIKLPMLRQAPKERATRDNERYKKELEPFCNIFSQSTAHGKAERQQIVERYRFLDDRIKRGNSSDHVLEEHRDLERRYRELAAELAETTADG